MLQPVSRVAAKYGSEQEPVRTSKGDLGKDEFLLLLVQQLKYQDPLSPMDNQEFVAQMAQFSALEQMKNLNENLESYMTVIALNDQRFQAVNMIGKEVTGFNTDGEEVAGRIDGVSFEEGLPVLHIGRNEMMMGDITEIFAGSGE